MLDVGIVVATGVGVGFGACVGGMGVVLNAALEHNINPNTKMPTRSAIILGAAVGAVAFGAIFYTQFYTHESNSPHLSTPGHEKVVPLNVPSGFEKPLVVSGNKTQLTLKDQGSLAFKVRPEIARA